MKMLRVCLFVIAVDELVVGAWNQFWPAGFYAHFPTVDLTPPFSEHFARDFGGATLGIGVLLLNALLRPRPHFVIPACTAFLVFAVPHFFFHMHHLEDANVGQAALLLVGNFTVVALGVAAVVLATVAHRGDA